MPLLQRVSPHPPSCHALQQEDLERQAPRAIILYEDQPMRSKKRAGAALYSYYVVLQGQEGKEGEW